MPLFTSNRDAGLLKGLNRELIHAFISVEVGVFKLNHEHTKVNIYGEAEQRAYFPKVRIFAMVDLDDKVSENTDHSGLDFNKSARIGFIKSDLKDKDLVIQEGDIIFYDGGYYEVDQVGNSNYWSGRSPDTTIGVTEDNWRLPGYDYSVMADCHLTRVTSLHIEDSRRGINKSIDDGTSTPKNI